MENLMEINKPGGFLLATMGNLQMKNLVEKDERGMLKIEDIENKIKNFEETGIITYGFQRGFDGDLVSEEMFDDLRVFEDVGWIEADLTNPHCKLTENGIKIFEQLEVPERVRDKFNSIFEKCEK